MDQERPMSLGHALDILARVHTREASGCGFEVMMGALPEPWTAGTGEYVQAWRTVRIAAGLPVDPE